MIGSRDPLEMNLRVRLLSDLKESSDSLDLSRIRAIGSEGARTSRRTSSFRTGQPQPCAHQMSAGHIGPIVTQGYSSSCSALGSKIAEALVFGRASLNVSGLTPVTPIGSVVESGAE